MAANLVPPTTVLDVKDTPAYLTTRALLDERQERGTLKPGSIDHLHSTVAKIHADLDPQDTDRPLNQSFFRYQGGKAALAFRRPDGSWESPESFTGSALSQMGYKVLGGGGAKFLENQRKQGEHGQKLAEVNWNHALQRQEAPSLLRTVQLPGQKFRTIRAVLSGGGRGYSVIDNLDVLQLFLDAPELRDLPVIESHITLDLMRIRLLLNPEDAILFDPLTGRIKNPTGSHDTTLNLPIPMLEVWNGEVGNAAIRVLDKVYFTRCLNGLGGYGDGGTSYRWNHTGGEDRAEKIKAGIGDAVKSARVRANGQIDNYKAATEVGIDNAFDLLDAWGDDLTAGQRERAKDAFQDETVTPGKKLASLVDAITLAAQDEKDLIKQRDLEAFGARILAKGLEQARKGGGRILVAEA